MSATGGPGRRPAGPPTVSVELPRCLAWVLDSHEAQPVWLNELGGVTFEISAPGSRWFAKWSPASSGLDLDHEAARLRWAGKYAAVPRLLDSGADEDGCWLLTEAMDGSSAVSDRWTADPATAVRAIGQGLRTLHDTLPVGSCPFAWSTQERVALAVERAGADELEPMQWHADHRHLTTADALAILRDVPDVDQEVVCHGDTCAPNTLITDEGRFSGHVDLGQLGTADRWADLAIATWSTTWNYGPGWEGHLLDAYGIDPDTQRTKYYRLLWDLT